MEWLVKPIIEIVKFIGAPAVRYVKYQIKFDEYLQKYERKKEELVIRMRDIESRLETEVVIGKVAKEEVEKWRSDVKQIEAQEMNKGGCLSRSCLAKDIDQKTRYMEELYANGGRFTEAGSLVIDDHSRKGFVLSTSELQGRDATKGTILRCLVEGQCKRIGVCGLGGVGKTTIMMHVHNDLLNLKDIARFKKIIFVSVSRGFDIVKLQKDIARKMQKALPENEDAMALAGLLLEMLRNGSYLLILDDVWEPFLLEDVGIPEFDGNNGCMLVLTTRFRNVAREMGCEEVINLEPLSENAALQLFLSKVGNVVQSSHGGGINKALEAVVTQVVNECGGLPLAIVTVARAMRDLSSRSLWEAALVDLRERRRKVAGSRIEDGATKDAFEILKFSYDRLGDERIQSCFLYCAMYPEDYEIPKRDLIEYWIVEGFIDDMKTRHEMMCKGHAILKQLEDTCLLERVRTQLGKMFHSEDIDAMKMHDLLRKLALDIMSSKDHNKVWVQAGMKMTKLPDQEDLRKVSLMKSSIKVVPRDLLSPQCQMLTTLLLPHNNLVTIPEAFFEGMLALKVLDLSHNHEMENLPESISNLESLTTLLLRDCWALRKLPSLSNCLALTKLDLGWSGIEQVPEGMELLINMKFLDLNCTKIKELPQGILLKYSRLECLRICISGVQVKAEELRALKSLEEFSGFLDWDELSACIKLIQNNGNWLRHYSLTVGNSSSDPQRSVIVGRDINIHNIDPLTTGKNFQLPQC